MSTPSRTGTAQSPSSSSFPSRQSPSRAGGSGFRSWPPRFVPGDDAVRTVLGSRICGMANPRLGASRGSLSRRGARRSTPKPITPVELVQDGPPAAGLAAHLPRAPETPGRDHRVPVQIRVDLRPKQGDHPPTIGAADDGLDHPIRIVHSAPSVIRLVTGERQCSSTFVVTRRMMATRCGVANTAVAPSVRASAEHLSAAEGFGDEVGP
jgi:hypothetical protein